MVASLISLSPLFACVLLFCIVVCFRCAFGLSLLLPFCVAVCLLSFGFFLSVCSWFAFGLPSVFLRFAYGVLLGIVVCLRFAFVLPFCIAICLWFAFGLLSVCLRFAFGLAEGKTKANRRQTISKQRHRNAKRMQTECKPNANHNTQRHTTSKPKSNRRQTTMQKCTP